MDDNDWRPRFGVYLTLAERKNIRSKKDKKYIAFLSDGDPSAGQTPIILDSENVEDYAEAQIWMRRAMTEKRWLKKGGKDGAAMGGNN